MAQDIKVPTLGESITEATIGRWLKQVGEAVAEDEPLVELETDKVAMEVNAPVAGVMSEIIAAEGDTVEVGSIIAKIDISGKAATVAPSKPAAPAPSASTAPPPAPSPAPAPAPAPQVASGANDHALAPAVRKLIGEHNLDAGKINGTGKDGRITKGDVLAAVEAGSAKQSTSAAPAAPHAIQSTGPRQERVPMSRLRKRIAERLKEAQNTAAMLTTYNEVDMGAVMAARNKYKDLFEKKHGVKLGFMSFFAQACVLALKEIPSVNAQIDGDDVVYNNYYDIGVAVSAPNGLVVPVVRDVDKMGFAETEKSIMDYAIKARDGKISLADMQGGTFTISNGGVFGSLMSSPILNPPQSAILGMHKIQERPMAVNGAVVIRPMMYLALSYDHRIIDGREAVTFLVRVKDSLENPERMLLDL